jgi:diadenosine tetraphosphate (Ap4A) HIT family hydrolase
MTCKLCDLLGRRDGSFIADWPMHVWRLADDQTWPGWSTLILKSHKTEIFMLTKEERAAAIEEVSRAAEFLKKVTGAHKMNIELLGNQEPHVHWHLVPRKTDDPAWNRPIWVHAHAPKELGARRHDELRGKILREIEGKA